MKTKDIILRLLAHFLMFSASGCGTLITLDMMGGDYYPKTKAACRSQTYIFGGTCIDLQALSNGFLLPFPIIDLPLSFAADILVFPYTAYRQIKYKNICDSLKE